MHRQADAGTRPKYKRIIKELVKACLVALSRLFIIAPTFLVVWKLAYAEQ